MDFDFGFDGGEDSKFDFDRVIPKSGKKGQSASKRKRTFQHRPDSDSGKSSERATLNPSSSQSSKALSAGASIDTSSSFSFSSRQSGNTKRRVPSIPIDESNRRTRRRIRQRQEKEKYDSNDDDEILSVGSHLSSTFGASSQSTASSDSFSTARSQTTTMRSKLSVRRGAGSSAYAAVDAGTYQMIGDECSFLCSTILSKTTRPSKAIESAIELATLLSSRKTRSMLWQGGSHDGNDDDNFLGNDNQRNSSSLKNGHLDPRAQSDAKDLSPIPKVWSSIFEVLALAATASGSSNNCSSSSTSISTSTSVGSIRDSAKHRATKSRTKSARRKEKALLQTGGSAIGTTTQTSGTANNHHFLSKGSASDPDLKDVLACMFYFLSWDCTMSGEHSIAAMGAVKSSALARKVRLAILERGKVLNGMLRLMIPSQPHRAAAKADSSQHDPFVEKIFSASTDLSNPPVSPLRTPMTSTHRRPLGAMSTRTSASTERDSLQSLTGRGKTSLSSKNVGDPTAMGRRKRKNRRKLKDESSADTINKDCITQQAEGLAESENCNSMPPPSNRSVSSLRRKSQRSDDFSFTDVSVKNQTTRNPRIGCQANDDGSLMLSEASMGGKSILTSRLMEKFVAVQAKVCVESLSKSGFIDNTEAHLSHGSNSEESSYFQRKFLSKRSVDIEGDRPWLSLVCLESLTRILTGKDIYGKTSCLEEEEVSRSKDRGSNDESDDEIDVDNNVVMVTNRLVGKSGMIPSLSLAMSQSMEVATKLVFNETHQKEKTNVNDEYWIYCYNRLKLLASIIDEACFFSERNRRSFCEDDPFSFQDRKKGLIFHILIFLQQCSNCDLNQPDQKRSEIMSLALRTLTSLTHDNSLAAEQMKSFIDCDVDCNISGLQGISVLANLVFLLEESPSLNPNTNSKGTGLGRSKKASDHDMHRYDGTVFCFTTLANVTEGTGIGRILMEIKVVLQSGESISWLEWLCQWFVKQTETFRHEILSIGKTEKLKHVSTVSSTAGSKKEELNQDDEERLVAAGNGCVVLACLITESEDSDPESSLDVRKMIKKQMPLNPDGSSSGLSLVVNTLKAYCNYYNMSMGEMSVAVVSPVRKLIYQLEEIAEFSED